MGQQRCSHRSTAHSFSEGGRKVPDAVVYLANIVLVDPLLSATAHICNSTQKGTAVSCFCVHVVPLHVASYAQYEVQVRVQGLTERKDDRAPHVSVAT